MQFTGIRETQESTRIGEKSLRLVIDRRTKLHTHVNTRAVRNEAAALTVPKSCQKAAGGFNLAFLFYFIYIYIFFFSYSRLTCPPLLSSVFISSLKFRGLSEPGWLRRPDPCYCSRLNDREFTVFEEARCGTGKRRKF